MTKWPRSACCNHAQDTAYRESASLEPPYRPKVQHTVFVADTRSALLRQKRKQIAANCIRASTKTWYVSGPTRGVFASQGEL